MAFIRIPAAHRLGRVYRHHRNRSGPRHRQSPILYSDVFTGILAYMLAFVVVRYYERLRQADFEKLRVAAEVNHHVRNCADSVTFSVYLKRDPELMKLTQDAVDRIGWTLREVLWETAPHVSPGVGETLE